MARRKLHAVFALLLLLATGTTPLHAHRLQTVFTTIELNPRTGMMEVVHRASVHDVSHMLTPAMQARGGLDDLQTRAELAITMSKGFVVLDGKGERIALQLVGAETDGGDFFVYQESPAETLPESMQVRHDVLRDSWPDITNYLNVHYPDGVQSLVFSGNSGLQALGNRH